MHLNCIPTLQQWNLLKIFALLCWITQLNQIVAVICICLYLSLNHAKQKCSKTNLNKLKD